MIFGNTDGIRDRILDTLEQIYDIRSQKYELANITIIEILKGVTEEINREVSVAIDRRGRVSEVAIGDSASVALPIIDIREQKLSGYRIIHTHPNGSSRLSALDLSALLKMKLDVIGALSVNTDYPSISMGFVTVHNGNLVTEITRELTVNEALDFNIEDRVRENEKAIQSSDISEDDKERALLIGIESEESMEELKELAFAAGIEVSEIVLQKKDRADTATYLGSGKLEDLINICQLTRSNVIVADDELSGSQIKNMEDITGVKVIDRTTLILEIFSRRAKSKEAKLQIELAQLKYRMTRLMGLGTVLSRTGGGIGTKGPGETKLETDRRRIRERHHDLSNELKAITKIRATQRENRHRQDLQQVALVGYTNAGKSTLRNALADLSAKDKNKKDRVYEADMLFATLDTTTRAIELPDMRVIALTDTVGFIRKLPHDLVEAFKSTLEEVINADVLIHVVDGHSEGSYGQVLAVEEVLTELGAVNKPMIMVLNKSDLGLSAMSQRIADLYQEQMPVLKISAKTSANLEGLLQAIMEFMPNNYRIHHYKIPYSEQKLVSLIHDRGEVLLEEFLEDGTMIQARVYDTLAGRLKDYETIAED